jgi:putative transcriptional regulator
LWHQPSIDAASWIDTIAISRVCDCERIVVMRGRSKACRSLAVALCLPGLFASHYTSRKAQYSAQKQLSVGNILVANEKLADPNFAESVILIVHFNKDNGTVGLILNRQTEIPVSRILPKAKHATKDPVYIGGPLEITSAHVLLRLAEKADRAIHVTGDVYITASEALIEKSVASQADPAKFRLYLGHAGWAPGQLEAEIRLGAWSLISSDPKIVFDREPDSLWSRLTNRQIAFAFPSAIPRFSSAASVAAIVREPL